MRAIDRVLPLLGQVRGSGRGRWIARCPAHEDRSPSLSLRACHDRVLLHCWAGCPVEAIGAALGLTLADLYDDREVQRRRAPAFPLKQLAAEGFAKWRASETVSCAEDLRVRDTLNEMIAGAVRNSEMAENEAWDNLELVYRGYSILEYRFEVLRTGTDRDALEGYRNG